MANLRAKLKEIASKHSEELESAPITAAEVVLEDIPEPETDPSKVDETVFRCTVCGRKNKLERSPELGISEKSGAWLALTWCPCGEPGGYIREADYNRWRATQRKQKQYV